MVRGGLGGGVGWGEELKWREPLAGWDLASLYKTQQTSIASGLKWLIGAREILQRIIPDECVNLINAITGASFVVFRFEDRCTPFWAVKTKYEDQLSPWALRQLSMFFLIF